MRTTGTRAAARRSRASTALETSSWSGAGPDPKPRATCRASLCTSPSSSSESGSGSSAWLSPAKLISCSNCEPAARKTIVPAADRASARALISAVLPTPGSPDRTSAPPLTADCWKNSRRRLSSRSRPINGPGRKASWLIRDPHLRGTCLRTSVRGHSGKPRGTPGKTPRPRISRGMLPSYLVKLRAGRPKMLEVLGQAQCGNDGDQ